MKSYLRWYCETLWHFESEKRRCKVCVLRHGIQHFSSYYNARLCVLLCAAMRCALKGPAAQSKETYQVFVRFSILKLNHESRTARKTIHHILRGTKTGAGMRKQRLRVEFLWGKLADKRLEREVTARQAMMAQTVSRGFFNLSVSCGSVVNATPRPLYPSK